MAEIKSKIEDEDVRKNKSEVQETYRASVQGTLLSCIQEKSERSRTSAKQLISSGRVCVDKEIVTLPTTEVKVGALVTVHRSAPPKPFNHPLVEKIWENEDYLVAFKDAGIATVNTAHRDREDTALFVLSKNIKLSNPTGKLFMVNRLDKSTSGFVVFAKSVEAKELLNKQWSRRVTKQTFVACVEGEIQQKEMVLSALPSNDKDGREDDKRRSKKVDAHVSLKKSSAKGGLHIVEIDVQGERIFNIRKIMADNRLSIFGDVRSRSSFEMKDRIALQQICLEFSLPQTGQKLCFERAFPSHFYSFLKGDKGLLLESSNMGLQRKQR